MEKLGEGACRLDVGGCGAEGPFEGVFHEDPLDKPDWKEECLQPQTWEAAMQQLRAPCGDGEMHGGQWAGLSWSSCPRATRSLAWPCTAVPLACSTSSDSSFKASSGLLCETLPQADQVMATASRLTHTLNLRVLPGAEPGTQDTLS